jgi:hypothetical protein
MENTKSFFYYTTGLATETAGVGMVSASLDLRRVLGQKWDKFEAFNLGVEVFRPASIAYTGEMAAVMCHVAGLPFMSNQYDSLGALNDGRVLEMFGVPSSDQFDNQQGMTFLQNINNVSFYRPSSYIIPQFITFLTTMWGDMYPRYLSNGNYNICISITGIDAYRIRRIERPFTVRRSYSKQGAMLVLNSVNAVSIDPIDVTVVKKRMYKFSDVNWRTIIGTDLYDKYEKFALVTRRVSVGTLPAESSFGNAEWVVFITGSNLFFETTSIIQSNWVNLTNNDPNNAISRNYSCPTLVANHHTLHQLARGGKDYYIENVFYKPPTDIGDIVVCCSAYGYFGLTSANTSNSFIFPATTIVFEIIPVLDI